MSYHRAMALQLPGEQPRYHFVEILLAVIAVLGLCALGCATPRAHSRRYPASVFEAARYEARTQPQVAAAPTGEEGAAFVVRTLHAAGLRFGTDGSARALWGYMRTAHRLVGAPAVRPGDILFFDTRGTGERPACADHAGVVERVAGDGRIGFIELRGGRLRHSFVDPAHPADRRGARGEILNSFLRPLRTTDPPGARYFAGEMLCGIARA
ncbi:MAG: CHAP domain-containing protein [Pseudomonadota bacterium]